MVSGEGRKGRDLLERKKREGELLEGKLWGQFLARETSRRPQRSSWQEGTSTDAKVIEMLLLTQQSIKGHNLDFFPLSRRCIYHDTPFCSAKFLQRNQLIDS